ncbi:MAG: NAD(P)H-hydrate epimerase [Candidatus Aenigmarchaeota archaeon]|nr:NAD(P)H-hydrate epimerase [Candidatus Aenigmarchaeota archaeon]
MDYLTAKQTEELDMLAQEKYGIPVLLLMENAGKAVSEEAVESLSGKGKVVLVCGKGNNGGDALVCARHLIENGLDCEIFLIGNPEDLKGEPKTNYEKLKAMTIIRRLSFESMEFFERELTYAELIVDAIFGTGLSREVGEPYKTIIEKINSSGKPVLSVDVPSGLDATAGEILGTCIKATKTVTFTLPKTGFVKRDGPKVTGEVIVRDISIPKSLLLEITKI